jgi:glycosyltransferase involved in cell wall biosynthesis
LYQRSPYQHTIEHDGSLLSIVIPYYNMGNYLLEAVQSVQNSQYPHKEIIIVNDGSDEQKSIEILSIAEKNHSCKIIHTLNQGLAEARNTGAKNSNGKFLAFLDPDDKVTPDYYSKAIWVLEKFSNVYGVGSFVKYFERKTSYWITSSPQPPYILAHNSVNSSALVYKRDAFLAGGLNDKQVDYGLEDYESVINMIHHGYNMVILPEVLFHYRVRKNSMFRNVNRNKLLYSYKYITEKHSEYFRDHFVELVNLLNANGPGFLYDSSGFERRVFSVQSVKSIVEKKIPKNSAAYRFAKRMFLGLTKRK